MHILCMCFKSHNLIPITLNNLAPTKEFSSITTKHNCWQWFVLLFNISEDNFDMFDNDWLIEICKLECTMIPFTLKVDFPIKPM